MSEQRAIEQVAIGARAGQRLQRIGRGMRRFARTQPLGAVGLTMLCIVILAALFAPVIGRHDPNHTSGKERLMAPDATHFFGTDGLGRDMYARIVHGARISLYVAFFSIALGTSFGYVLGIFSGYFGGKTDILLQRVIDAMLAFPSILLALTMVAVLGPGIDKVITAISVVYIPRAARVARGVSLSVKENVYIDAARVVGASTRRIMFRHILPNSLAPYLILASVALGAAILIEASLSFLGLGVPPPAPSWGRMLSGSSMDFALIAPWLMIFPGIAIMLLVLSFNLFGDSLRDVWDPRLRGSN